MGYRPEDISLGSGGKTALNLEAQVIQIELLGAEELLHLTVAGLNQSIIARIPANHGISENDAVSLNVPAKALHCFDAVGRRQSQHHAC